MELNPLNPAGQGVSTPRSGNPVSAGAWKFWDSFICQPTGPLPIPTSSGQSAARMAQTQCPGKKKKDLNPDLNQLIS